MQQETPADVAKSQDKDRRRDTIHAHIAPTLTSAGVKPILSRGGQMPVFRPPRTKELPDGDTFVVEEQNPADWQTAALSATEAELAKPAAVKAIMSKHSINVENWKRQQTGEPVLETSMATGEVIDPKDIVPSIVPGNEGNFFYRYSDYPLSRHLGSKNQHEKCMSLLLADQAVDIEDCGTTKLLDYLTERHGDDDDRILRFMHTEDMKIDGHMCRVSKYRLLRCSQPDKPDFELVTPPLDNPKKYYFHGTHIKAALQIMYDGRFMESTPSNQRTECTDAGVYSYDCLDNVLQDGYACPHWLHTIVPPTEAEYDKTTGDLTPAMKQQTIKDWYNKVRKPKQLVFVLAKTDRLMKEDKDKRSHPKTRVGSSTQYVWPADGISARQVWMISGYPVLHHHKAGRYRLRLDALSRDPRHANIPDAFNAIESLNKWRTVQLHGTTSDSTYESPNGRYLNSSTISMEHSDYDVAKKVGLPVYLPVGPDGKPTITAKEYFNQMEL